jgi:hypothetical protein
MRDSEFDPREAKNLFLLALETREFWRDWETVLGYSGILDFDILKNYGLNAIENYCHVMSTSSSNESMRDYLADSKNLNEKDLDGTLKGMRIINALIRQDKYRSTEML